jgi:methionyl aminopeptidase
VPHPALELLREAGRIAAAARAHGAALVRPGASLRDVCAAVEDEIRRRGGGLAFPVQSSRNAIAAHYCPSPEDGTLYAAGDVAKLDLGVHLEGWVVDTAMTVNVGDRPENQPLVDASAEALAAAIAAAGPGVSIRRLSEAIARAVRGRGFRPVRNLCGHGVGRWIVHCPPPVPNLPDDAGDVLAPGMVVAIEPFATDGNGHAAERGEAEVFRVDPRRSVEGMGDPEVLAAVKALQGLPFARRQLGHLPRPQVEATLHALRQSGLLAGYPPLVESTGRPVSQAEHTVYVGDEGVEVLTR